MQENLEKLSLWGDKRLAEEDLGKSPVKLEAFGAKGEGIVLLDVDDGERAKRVLAEAEEN